MRRAATSVRSSDADVRPRRELVDEVARHALLERLAAADDRHAARVGREEHRRLPGGVARADDVDVEPVRVRRLAARRAVGDALARQAVEAVDGQPPPRDAAREDDRPRPQDVAAVEEHLAASRRRSASIARVTRISAPSRRACWSARLASSSPETPAGSRGSSRSATRCRPGRRAPRARPRSCAGPRRRRTRRPPARRARRRRSPCRTPRRPARCRARAAPRPGAAAAARRVLPPTTRIAGQLVRRPAASPPHCSAASRRVGREPRERDLVAVEEAPQVGARGVPALPDDDRPRRRRLRSDALRARPDRSSDCAASAADGR